MDVWSQDRYGGPDVLRAERRTVPAPAAGEVLVRVGATALNSADVHVMRGEPLLLRLLFGLRRPRQAVPGRDVAGTVVAVGGGVTGFVVGDRVAGEVPGGGLAPFVAVRADRLVPVPDAVDERTAAALPLAGGTAWQALDRAAVETGSRVLVVGAGGGVGTFTVRLAVLRGARVHALCSPRAAAAVTGLGAVAVAGHDHLTTLAAGTFDAVVDIGGRAPLRVLRRLLRDGGVVVGVAGGANRVTGPLGRMVGATLLSVGSRRRLRALAAVATPSITARLLDLVASGALRPMVDGVHPFAQAREALTRLDEGGVVGKVLVVPEASADSGQSGLPGDDRRLDP